jgi:hypothetical protein
MCIYERQPSVTEAVFLFGEIAQYFGEWKCNFGHAEIIPAECLSNCACGKQIKSHFACLPAFEMFVAYSWIRRGLDKNCELR